MRICSTVDLREKDVVNLCDGSKLGCAQDFDFDVCSGKIVALVIAGDSGIFGFSRKQDIVIPWENVQCFGEDTILVKLDPLKMQSCSRERKKGKKAVSF